MTNLNEMPRFQFKKKILIAVSSTGGHIYPGVALAGALKKKGWDVFFVGKKSEIIKSAGYRFYVLSSVGYPRAWSVLTSIFFLKLFYSIFQSIKILLKEKPGIVIGFGGYVSFPVIFSAWLMSIPSIIHEQNFIPGLANKLSAEFAGSICVSFEDSKKYFPSKKVVFTGNPVRSEILNISKPLTYRLPFTVLIFGGSQGAHNINIALINLLAKLLSVKEKIRFIHVTGENDFEIVSNAYKNNGFTAEVHKYLYNIETAYENASLVVCRAGATTIAELIALKMPAILIPYPYSTEDHQKANAKYLVDNGCAILIEEKEIKKLPEEIINLVNNPVILAKMSESYKKISYPDPIKTFLDLIEKPV
ncbi:MAG: undecaprenyldiphospho-muramoylpentapeptide beta-N-acetylglucosaminyltransferase [Elusimicrobiota bacterium]|nr:undecaprenyldiphospho-muramoylpentapeptide beta-N-acetylglucosaminyltransferase [Elusimicrobiota bacterium]